MYALEQAKAFVESSIYKNVVIIGSEHITWLLDWSDRATAVLFGDAAGSFVISATEDAEAGELLSFHNGLSSDKLDILRIPNFGSAMNRFTENAAANITWNFDGAEIFKSGIRAMGKASEEAIKKSGLQKEDIEKLFTLTEIFTSKQLKRMRSAYGNLGKIDPTSSTGKKLLDKFSSMPKDELLAISSAGINFLSLLAAANLLSLIHI